MATIVIRSVKGSALTHTEMDSNFSNLNDDKPDVIGTPATDSLATFDANDDVQDSGDTIATLSATIQSDTLAAVYPVGSIYINANVSTNPNTLLGFGTWVTFGAGRVPVGIDIGDTDFDTGEETGGAKTHTLVESEIPSHVHSLGYRGIAQGSSGTLSATFDQTDNSSVDTDATGGDGAHNNVQPYIVVYMWKRSA